ncbi:hypothetical protein UA08_01062 [Talaromyces atroroseus]|uniref:Malate dehydrogenase n=1 Tax=Talaromyces atroroseus TaxID=1441469 RepID=A0A225B0D3_TALAT|nr:hypothetical protein UA08_01062 [Talaromyces atroroseus]OKL64164.1 hypothetical protein UA08_01062 [Talaromyces atroroseus]
MRFGALVLASVATIAAAAPTNNVFNNVYDYNSNLEEFYCKVSSYIEQFAGDVASATCDMSNVALPAAASVLPSPTGTLKYVAIGRGTQNYTCADSTEDTVPVQIGAVANLYDASCIAANFSDLLDLLTEIVIDFALPNSSVQTPLAPANIDLLGHHYFSNSTTPTFNLNTTPEKQYGIAMASKKDAIDAPYGSIVGQNNEGYGATTWLYLTTIAGTVGDYKEVYRVNTAGGNAPTNCSGQASTIEIQYSAQYYFYV